MHRLGRTVLGSGMLGEMLGRVLVLLGEELELEDEDSCPYAGRVGLFRRFCIVDSFLTLTLWPFEARSLIKLLDVPSPGKFFGEYTVITEDRTSPRR